MAEENRKTERKQKDKSQETKTSPLLKAYKDGEYEDLFWRFTHPVRKWPNPPAVVAQNQAPVKYMCATGEATHTVTVPAQNYAYVCFDPDSGQPWGSVYSVAKYANFFESTGVASGSSFPAVGGNLPGGYFANGSWRGGVDPRFILPSPPITLESENIRIGQFQSKRASIDARVTTDAYGLGRVCVLKDEPLLFGPSTPARQVYGTDLSVPDNFQTGGAVPLETSSTIFRDPIGIVTKTAEDIAAHVRVTSIGGSAEINSHGILTAGPPGVRTLWDLVSPTTTEDRNDQISLDLRCRSTAPRRLEQTYGGRVMYLLFNDSAEGTMQATFNASIDYNVFATPTDSLSAIAMKNAHVTGNSVEQRQANPSHSTMSPFVATMRDAREAAVNHVRSTSTHPLAPALAAAAKTHPDGHDVGSTLGGVIGGLGVTAVLGPEAAPVGEKVGSLLGGLAGEAVSKLL